MKKILNFSIFYLILGLLGGVYFREFTKAFNYTDYSTLSVIHTHALILGFFFFLIVLLLEKNFNLSKERSKERSFKSFLIFYNIGLLALILMMLIRGSLQVMSYSLTTAINASISGISGLAHITITIGLIFFIINLKKSIEKVCS